MPTYSSSPAFAASVTTHLIIASALCASAFAELTWEHRQIDFHPQVNELACDTAFHFTNTGTSLVTISDVKTSCGCTTAALAKKTYAPGESGTVQAKFTIGDRVGLQQKQIMVKTDNREEPFTQLTIRAFIPELVTWAPKVAHWAAEDGPVSRSLVITPTGDRVINIVGVQTTDDRVFAKLIPIRVGRQYQVAITPRTTGQPLRAQLRIETDYPPEKPKVYFVPIEIGRQSLPVSAPAASAPPPVQPAAVTSPSVPPAVFPGQ